MTQSTRVLFMGTPDFAVPSLNRLVQAGYQLLVITQPDRPVGRKKTLSPPPVKKAALEHGLTVLQPAKVRTDEVLEQLQLFQPDVLITAAYGQLLPERLLQIPKVGCLNVHASLLPRWRGAAPIHRALMAGDAETGITLMEMRLALDAGPIVASAKTPIHLEDNVGTLHDRLAELGASVLFDVLPDYLAGRRTGQEQPEEGVTYAQRILRADELLTWQRPLQTVHNHIRGLSPWPGAVTGYEGQALKIWAAHPYDEKYVVKPGVVEKMEDGKIVVQCTDGRLELLTVQPAGKRKMSAAEWFRGVLQNQIQLESVLPE